METKCCTSSEIDIDSRRDVVSPPMKIFIVRRLSPSLIHTLSDTRNTYPACRSISEAPSVANRKLAVIRKREKPYEKGVLVAGDDETTHCRVEKKRKEENKKKCRDYFRHDSRYAVCPSSIKSKSNSSRIRTNSSLSLTH